MQHGAGVGEGGVLLVPQAHRPDPILWDGLPLHRGFGGTHVPGHVVAHVDLPVVAAGIEALGSQHAQQEVEALGELRHLPPLTPPHLGVLVRQEETGVSRLGVQCQQGWNWRQKGQGSKPAARSPPGLRESPARSARLAHS
ncbi:hypothetical protein chiPu_0025563 [Chiloscyllium punctatum]|uniref:Uncharacterized protein n=1 Tax=Chiloscyllium punctatum TaxID=137246 RepID=A0A401TH65_CHIPU|nr:hypothetical protein [Chiloscyllium punctatum]